MAGIIIYIPQAPLINPTSEIVPVNTAGTFIDSNIKNIVNDRIETKNVFDDIIGLKLDFINNEYIIGDPLSTNFIVDTINQNIAINSVTLSNPIVITEKMLSITINGQQYYIQLYITP